MTDLKKGPRGLPAITRLREERSRRGARWTMQAGLIAAGAVVLSLIFHTVISRQDLAAGKHALLAKQAAVQATLGAEWSSLRQRIEEHVAEAAKPYPGDAVEKAALTSAFRTQPGLYLRMRVADAGSPESIARVAASARKDAFVACLLREPNERGLRGELDGGAFAEQPWNLGRAYATTRILSEDWVAEVKAASEPMRLRVFSEQYEKAIRTEIPLAIEIVKRAQFFLLVLDEDADLPAAADGGPVTEEALQLVAHPARVFLFDLKSDRPVLRLRRSGEARVIQAGERAVTDSETLEAMQRQANNCALGRLVEAALQNH